MVLDVSIKKSAWMTQIVGHKVLVLTMVALQHQLSTVIVMLAGMDPAAPKVSSQITYQFLVYYYKLIFKAGLLTLRLQNRTTFECNFN